MAESLGDGGNLRQNGSSVVVPLNWAPGIQNINDLPVEVLTRLLACMSQESLVNNRAVCRHWRDAIDDHIPMECVTLSDGPFLERKMELRITKCEVKNNLYDIRFWLKNPQSIRTLILNGKMSDQNILRLLIQVRPYLEVLTINLGKLDKNIFPLGHVFPNLREIGISHETDLKDPVIVPWDIPYLHQVPLLTKLSVNPCYNEWKTVDQTYLNVFHFLGKHGQRIKHLDLNIEDALALALRVDPQEPFQLSDALKALVYNGTLQFHSLSIHLQPRYVSSWGPIIQSQKNLVKLILTFYKFGEDEGVEYFSYILPGILGSSLSLQHICLEAIPLVSSDEDEDSSYAPFDCSVFKNAVNLTRLELRGGEWNVDDDLITDIINLGQIPLGSLKQLAISEFVCDSGELQSLVDNAQRLETLDLLRTIAPSDDPRFPSSGVHGGIIKSFLDKPQKKAFYTECSINYSNEAENEKLDAIDVLYPNAHERTEDKDSFHWRYIS